MSQPGQPSQPPPLGLLRLREADIVRLCGLSAAAQGLDLLTRRALTRPRREGDRLRASSTTPGSDALVESWAELIGEPPAIGLRWGCSQHAPEDERRGPACEHIAALLTAWVRSPSDFVTPQAAGEAAAEAAPSMSPDVDIKDTPPHDALDAHRQGKRAERPEQSERPPVQPRLMSAPRQMRPQAPLTLGDELRRLPAQEVIAIARRTLGADLDETEARAKLEAALSDRALTRALVSKLDAEAVETLVWLRLAGGALTSADVDALAARAGRPASGLRAALSMLERHGLVFGALLGSPTPDHPAGGADAREEPGWRRLRGWRIAPETRDALPQELPIPAHERPWADSGTAGRARLRVESGSARALLLALALLARAPAPLGPFAAPRQPFEREGRPFTGADAPQRRGRTGFTGSAGSAGSALAPEDLPDAQAHELARGVGVDAPTLRLARRTLLWAREQEAAQPVTDLARTPPPARLHAYRAGFRVWLGAQSPAELVDLERLTKRVRLRYDLSHEAFRPAALAEEAAQARAFVVRLIGQAASGAWQSIGDLLDLIWRVNPLFLRGRQMAFSAPAWRIERISDGRPLRPTTRAEWDEAEGAYIHALLRWALRCWGVVDLAFDEDATPISFRLTPLGMFLLARAEDAESERRAQAALSFDWGPMATPTRDGALAAHPLAAAPALLDTLERWARVTALAGGRLIYSFGADEACANFDLGLRPDDALAPLRALGLARAAQTLAPRLEGWRADYGDARLSAEVTLIEGRDEATLREALAALPEVAGRARWLSATCVALTKADGAALSAALARRGWEL
ncbi:MAG TPA: hypothetical protein VF812_16065 [Ktedonobacterales bacterium]